jgi:uncharacterized membrane protein YqjE
VISDPSTGLPPPVRGLLQVAFEALRTRLDLAAVELEIQLLLLVRLLAWFLGALACALLGLLCAATALIVALWNTHRMLGLLGGSAAFLALAALLGYLGVRTLRRESGPLDASLGQLAEDARRAGGAP